MSNIILKINGNVFDRWASIHVKKSMDTISGAFGIVTSDFFSGSPNDWGLKIGDECVVEINDQKISTGYIDELPFEYSEDNYYMQILGRDKTADLIDCSYAETANEWKNQTIRNIITNLISPYNLILDVDTSVTSTIDTRIETFKAEEGEAISEILMRLCADNAILPMCYGEGKLTLTAASTQQNNDTIELGVNAKRGTLFQNNKNRYKTYIIKGQGIGNDNKELSDFITPTATAIDNVVQRERKLVIFADGITDIDKCTKKAKWELRKRAGKSRARQYVIEGWTQSNDKIWRINSNVRVRDSVLNTDETMLITDIEYFYDSDSGEIANITVVDTTTYNINSTKLIRTGFDR